MRFEVGNKITVINPSGDLMRWCRTEMTMANPEYDKKIRMGLWAGNTPERFCLYEFDAGKIILPFGTVGRLREMYPDSAFISRIKPSERFLCSSNINLYDYQEKAVNEALKAKNGIVVMPCGAGKTQVALEIIARLGSKALWLTHTSDLLNQSLNRAKSVLNCDTQSYGTITEGKVKIGSGITFATVQTMVKLDLSLYRDTWGCVVVDECHKAVGSPTKAMQFYRVLSNLSCRYKFGVTATPKRADGLHKAMFALIGDKICEVSREEVAHTTCPVEVRFLETNYMPDLDVVLSVDGTINYASLVNDLTSNQHRFEEIMLYINNIPSGRPMLVLANRVAYLEKMMGAYKGRAVCLSSMGASKKAKEERKEVLRKLNDGEIDCVFATYQLAKEGLDVPNLRYVVFATPEKDETTVAQAAGRVGRKADGKEKGIILDFCDSFSMFAGWKKNVSACTKNLGIHIKKYIDILEGMLYNQVERRYYGERKETR